MLSLGNMIEAVNSVLSNAPFTKAVVEQQSVATSFAANPARVQQAAIQAPYISLYIKVDTNFDKAILQIRDSDTGDVVRQIPTETQLEAYRRAQTANAVRTANVEEDIYVPQEQTVEVKEASPVPTSTSTPAPQASYVSAPSTPTPNAPAPSAPVPQASIDTEA
jgi:hypothetical protein